MSVMENKVAHNGKNQTLKQWAVELGITPKALEARYLRGAEGAKLLKPMREYYKEDGVSIQREILRKRQSILSEDYKRTRVAFKGMNMMLSEWADRLKIDFNDLAIRYAKGKRGAALFRVI
jgi:hypothetical protein